MDIKENFYSKLQQIREDYDQNEAENKRKNDKYIKKRNKHGLKSDTWREKSDMINKKAVTGLEEEQLDEISKEKIKRKKNPGSNDRHGGPYKITKGTYRTGSSRENETEISHGQGRKITKTLRSEKDPEKKSEKWRKFWNTGSLEEAEQLDEISYQKAREVEDKAAGVYHKDYDDETSARRKYMRNRTPESKKEAEEAGKKRKKSAKRVIRFQNYANKKKDK